MNERKKPSTTKFAISIAALIACGSITIATTYALFTNQKTVNTHLVISGNIKAELYLKELKQDVLDDNGLITTKTVDLATLIDKDGNNLVVEEGKGVNLINYTDKIFAGVNIIPTMEGSAKFLLVNTGDMAFDYTVDTTKVAYDSTGSSVDSAAILDQVEWTITEDTNKRVLKGGSTELDVSYVFNDDANNNDAQLQSMDLDIIFKLSSVAKS